MDMLRLFVGVDEVALAEHHRALRDARASYVATLLLTLEHGVDLSAGVRARVLAAAWSLRDHELAEALLARPAWGVAAVVKALALLDAGRQARALRRRIAALEETGSATARTLGKLRSQANDLEREGSVGSVSGALARHVRRWLAPVRADALTGFAFSMPGTPWRQVADLVHPRPDALAAPWFLPVAFGGTPPEGSALAACASATPAQLAEVAESHRVPYSHLRTVKGALSPALREAVARYESLDTLLWFYEELRAPAVDRAITARLDAGEEPTLGCGKLMERVLTLRDAKAPFWQRLVPVVDGQLSRMRLPLDAPVVVLGDASSSMTVAIRVATIIGSVFTVLTRAELRFFNGGLMLPKRSPRSASDVLAVTDETRANGCTAPAAALWPSLERRALVRTFVVVTDEEENSECQKMRFDAMLARYRAEVYPAQVTFVSFIGQQARGQMTSALALGGVPYRQLRLDRERPDLTRLDAMLGEIAVQSPLFAERASALAAWLDSPGARIEEAAGPLRSLLGESAQAG